MMIGSSLLEGMIEFDGISSDVTDTMVEWQECTGDGYSSDKNIVYTSDVAICPGYIYSDQANL